MTRHRSFAPSTGAFVVVPEENEKSEPFSNRKQVRIFLVWWARVDSNHRSWKAADLQSVPIGHSGTRPYSFVSAARTACIYYHAQSSLSTICNRFYRNFCTNLSNKLAPWKNRPEINVPERFFLELVTGVEPATHWLQIKFIWRFNVNNYWFVSFLLDYVPYATTLKLM